MQPGRPDRRAFLLFSGGAMLAVAGDPAPIVPRRKISKNLDGLYTCQHYWMKGEEAITADRGRFNWWGRDPEWKDQFGFRGKQDVEKRVGEWNRSEVVCEGDSITCLVNGVVVNHGERSSHTEGRIVIQSEGAEVFIRRLELLPVRRRG